MLYTTLATSPENSFTAVIVVSVPSSSGENSVPSNSGIVSVPSGSGLGSVPIGNNVKKGKKKDVWKKTSPS